MTFIKKYGIWEYFLAIIGMVLMTKQVYSYVVGTLEATTLELAVFVGGVLLVAAPAFLVRKVKEYGNKLVKKQ